MRNKKKALKTGMPPVGEGWFSHRLLEWYQVYKRDLPWRETKDPFSIWLSEIILQQTRVNQGMPYYHRFINTFATVEEFALANLDDILKLWQGLGYYSRARNMHQCARTIVDEYDGKFPDNYVELLKLKGIGKYTAAAIASICFEEPVPTVDGNVFRVLSRIFGISDDIIKSRSFNVFFAKAKTLMPNTNPGDFNQAMMEFGAMVCTPKSPACQTCVFSEGCYARQHDMVMTLPVKTKKLKIKQRYFNYRVYTYDHHVLIRQRQVGDIWAGLFEFALEESENSPKSSTFDRPELQYSSDEMVHQLSHQKLYIKFHVYEIDDDKVYEALKKENQLESVAWDALGSYAVPKPIELFLNHKFCQ